MTFPANRRQFLLAGAATSLAIGTAQQVQSDQAQFHRAGAAGSAAEGGNREPDQARFATRPTATPAERFRFCLNTSTIRGHKLTLVEEVEAVAAAGYSGIEPWLGEINDYKQAGGSLSDLKKRISDLGLTVESAIGFAQWIVDDPSARARGLEDLKRDMDLVLQIGGHRIAAPPTGATEQSGMNLLEVAERYRAALVVGESIGVVPQLELWGFSKTLSRMGELVFVAAETGHPAACLLPDIYHIYKGGSDFSGLKLIHGSAMHAFHVNDYPAAPPRETIRDSDRVYPGDGIAPVVPILTQLYQNGFAGALSLELFNATYYQQPVREVLETGLRKMRDAVAQVPAAA